MTMGDRIAVLNQGRLQQLGTPMELYRWPSNIFVAQFIGSPAMGLLPVMVGPNATLILGRKRIQVEGEMVEPLLQREGQNLTAGLRPEHWHLAPATNRNLQAEVSHCERLGNEQILTCRLLDDDQIIHARTSAEININAGDAINLDPEPTGWRLFDADGEAIR